MTLRLLDDVELQELLDTTLSKSPKHLSFYQSVKFKLEKTFPVATCEVYEYSENDSHYYFAYKQNKLLPRDGTVITSEGTFNSESFLNGFEKFAAEKDILKNIKNGFLFIAFSLYTDLIVKYLENDKSVRADCYPTYLYYMTKAQEDYVLNYKFPELKPGFELGSANPDTEAKHITSTWNYSVEGDDEQTKMKLRYFPSAVIRHDGVPIAYEMIDHYGFLNHQFTHIEYRNQGYGRIIELDISKKFIERGFRPYKCVELARPAVLDYSSKSPYWTMYKYEDNQLAPYIFLVLQEKNLI